MLATTVVAADAAGAAEMVDAVNVTSAAHTIAMTRTIREGVQTEFGAHSTRQRSTVVSIMPVRELPPLLGTSHFRVLIGARELGFAEVGPLSSETDVTLPPLERSHRFETVVLRRALTQSTELYDWRRKIMSGKDDRRPVTIHQLDAAGGAIAQLVAARRCLAVPLVGAFFQRRRK